MEDTVSFFNCFELYFLFNLDISYCPFGVFFISIELFMLQ